MTTVRNVAGDLVLTFLAFALTLAILVMARFPWAIRAALWLTFQVIWLVGALNWSIQYLERG